MNIKKNKIFLDSYFSKMHKTLSLDKNLHDNIVKTKVLFEKCSKRKGRVVFFGNGGSAAIASHLSVDLNKNAKIQSISFNDPGIITCYANDFGYKNWISKTIELSLTNKDVVVLISSSGKSLNILNAAKYAKKKNIQTITLSGMSKKNNLKKMGLINFWVDSKSYNIIETAHQFYMMAVIDLIIGKAEYKAN
jgi:D-sedoheptulose 7-phosphate isomerase|tara:strand:- start:880 stop:1455 length:576 start_codon:yes stop_codon:yes gene_type:complete